MRPVTTAPPAPPAPPRRTPWYHFDRVGGFAAAIVVLAGSATTGAARGVMVVAGVLTFAVFCVRTLRQLRAAERVTAALSEQARAEIAAHLDADPDAEPPPGWIRVDGRWVHLSQVRRGRRP